MFGEWRPIETAPRDKDILVWYDHDKDTYQCKENPDRLTDYAVWAESGDFVDGRGVQIAKWQEQHWESTDEYGSGYYLPAFWFAKFNGDYEIVINPTHWMPLPTPPSDGG